MINVTLRQLRYFDALARHGHFGRAAEACSISQPALSMQIKEMEETLGGALLERSPRQIALTRFGEELLQRVREILRSVDELGDFARASRDRLAGRLRVGMIPTVAPSESCRASATRRRSSWTATSAMSWARSATPSATPAWRASRASVDS